jgi:RNA polymerase sigma-70 factor (ECF subfamily)
VNDSANGDLDALMARLADGDRAAFTPVFRALWPAVRRLCVHLLGTEADGEDAAQQAMEKILSRASAYDRTRPALPWSLGIASWECRTLRRKQLRRRESAEDSALGLSDQRPLADEVIVERDLIDAGLAALGQLSASDRDTLLTSYFDEAGNPSVSGATLRKRR